MTSEIFVKVFNWNVLSQKLCSNDWFPECTKDATDPEGRFVRISDKILAEVINEKGILCMQEVSQTWAGRFQLLFETHNYTFMWAKYGTEFSDYMGVAIAWPRDTYILKDSAYIRIADKIPRPEEKKTHNYYWWDFLGFFATLQGMLYGKPQLVFDQWEGARKKWNMMPIVSLVHRTSSIDDPNNHFVVATYHMPCSFNHPTIMALHSHYAIRSAQEWCDEKLGLPENLKGRLIFAGDMNFKPDSAEYKMITEGLKPENMQSMIDGARSLVSDWFRPIPGWRNMVSVYREINTDDSEPYFTNYTKTKRNDEPFIAILDYIFTSIDWNIKDVLKLPPGDPKIIYDTPLPTIEEPSDHLMIGATISIGNTI